MNDIQAKVEQLTELVRDREKGKARKLGNPLGPWYSSAIENAGACFVERRKYYLIDILLTNRQQSGLWMVDKESGMVYSIAGYGKRNRPVAHIGDLIEQILQSREGATQ